MSTSLMSLSSLIQLWLRDLVKSWGKCVLINVGGDIRIRSPFGRSNPQPLFLYICILSITPPVYYGRECIESFECC
jgi:hypothetical protein